MTTKIFTKNDGMSTVLTTLYDSLKLLLLKKLITTVLTTVFTLW